MTRKGRQGLVPAVCGFCSDHKGDPLAGAAVTFAVHRRRGRSVTTATTTDADRRASTALTLGPDPGRNTVVARVAELKPVIFSATRLGDSHDPYPDFGATVSRERPGAAFIEPFVVEVRDQNNKPLEGARYPLRSPSAMGFFRQPPPLPMLTAGQLPL